MRRPSTASAYTCLPAKECLPVVVRVPAYAPATRGGIPRSCKHGYDLRRDTAHATRTGTSHLEQAAHTLGGPGHAGAGHHADAFRADGGRETAHPVHHHDAGDRVLFGQRDRVR